MEIPVEPPQRTDLQTKAKIEMQVQDGMWRFNT
jgi:hypothetical protein